MATNWGKIINNIGFGTIYNESWFGEYIFSLVVGDANDFSKRVSDDSGTMEAHSQLVDTMEKSLR